MRTQSNPAWTNSILKTSFQRIAEAAPRSAMPLSTDVLDERTGKMKRGWKEYGTGHYGTVFPTNTEGLVMKITSDPTEAAFVAAYLSLPTRERPNGIVGYHAVVQITGVTKNNRPVYVIWRDEAQHVGVSALGAWVRNSRDPGYYMRSHRISINLLWDAKLIGDKIKNLLKKPTSTPSGQHRRAQTLERLIDSFQERTGLMQSEPMAIEVGRAMDDMLHNGLLLADVHANNIGMPTGETLNDIGETCIITDPGHAVALDDRYAGLKIREI